MTSLVVGLGEIGNALYEVLADEYGDSVLGFDLKHGMHCDLRDRVIGMLHICIPWTPNFVEVVNDYVNTCNPDYTVIHSSVPVGTTIKIQGKSFHSPVRGKHPDMKKGLLQYTKYVSFDGLDFYEAQDISSHFAKAGMNTKVVHETKTTELGKLLALCRYGVYIAFAKEQEAICEKFNVPYHKAVTDFEKTRNDGVDENLKQPLLFPFEHYVGGHCTVEDMELLLNQTEAPLLEEAYLIDRNTQVWGNCNIYPTARIGKGCNIGNGCEIGHDVSIGNNVRIGAHCFIPEGVEIEDDCFIAPKVTFSNDKYPPSKKAEWGTIQVKKGAVIGMGSIVLPDVTIGENAMIGAGAVVTKNVPAGETWYGNPAHAHGRHNEEVSYS